MMQTEKHTEIPIFARSIVCAIVAIIWFHVFDQDYVVLVRNLNYETIIGWDETGSLYLTENMLTVVKRGLFVAIATDTLVLIIQLLYKKITSTPISNFELGRIYCCLFGIECMWMIENRLTVMEGEWKISNLSMQNFYQAIYESLWIIGLVLLLFAVIFELFMDGGSFD